MKKKITVFGSFVVDLTAKTPHLPAPGETVKGLMFRMGPGGKGFNQGVAAYKAGADVTMITKLGKDTFADIAINFMETLNMNTDYIFYNEEVATGTALIMVDQNTSQNEIVVISGACGTINESDIAKAEEVIRKSDYVLLQLEVNQEAIERVVDLCCKHGIKVVLNPAPYQPISDEFLSKIEIVTPNEVEAEELTGICVDGLESAKKAAIVLFEKGVKHVVITLGNRGVFVSSQGREEIIPPFKVDAVDTTGAGDGFNGGFITALAEGKDIWEAAKFANALAALSVQKFGTAPAMPTREEIDKFIARQA